MAKPLGFTRDMTRGLLPDNTSFLYRVTDGEFRLLGRYDQVR